MILDTQQIFRCACRMGLWMTVLVGLVGHEALAQNYLGYATLPGVRGESYGMVILNGRVVVRGQALPIPGTGAYLASFRHLAAAGTYQTDFVGVTPTQHGGLREARLAATGPRALVSIEENSVVVRDGVTLREVRRFPGGPSYVLDLAAADVDGNGIEELLVVSPVGTTIFRGDGTIVRTTSLAWGSQIVAGQLDNDPGIEVVTNNGGVYDYATDTVQAPAIGNPVRTLDSNGDGRAEVLLSTGAIYDVVSGSSLYPTSYPRSGYFAARDVNGDGRDEVINVSGSVIDVLGVQGTTYGALYSHQSNAQIESFAVGNTDNDPAIEIAWSESGGSGLQIAELSSFLPAYRHPIISGEWVGPFSGDTDGNGQPEIISVVYEQGVGARILVLDATTYAQQSFPTFSSMGGSSRIPTDAVVYDVNGDGRSEVIVVGVGGSSTDPLIEIFGQTAQGWSRQSYGYVTGYYAGSRVMIGDVRGDSAPEIVALSTMPTGFSAALTFSLQGNSTGMTLLGSGFAGYTMTIANLDQVGKNEVVIEAPAGGVRILDLEQSVVRAQSAVGSGTPPISSALVVGSFIVASSASGVSLLEQNGQNVVSLLSLPFTSPDGPSSVLKVDLFPGGVVGVSNGERYNLHIGVNPSPVYSTPKFGVGTGRWLAYPNAPVLAVNSPLGLVQIDGQ